MELKPIHTPIRKPIPWRILAPLNLAMPTILLLDFRLIFIENIFLVP